MSKQTWNWTKTDFVEIDYLVAGWNPTDYLCYVDVRQAWTDEGDIYTPDDFDDVELSKLHDGTEESVIESVKEEFGVTLKPRPDLGVGIFEIVDGV